MPEYLRERVVALSPSGDTVRIGTNVFRKQLLRFGRWVHPADNAKFFEVTSDLCDRIVRNFEANNFNDFVPLQLAKDSADPHKVGPEDTVGRIVGLQKGSDGLYALMEFGDQALADKAGKNLIPGVSAGIALDYHNKEQNANVGPVLRHVVLCNEPYIKNLRGFDRVPLAEAGINESYEVLEFSEVQRTDMNRKQLEDIAKKMGIDTAKFAADDALLAEVNRLLDVTNANLAEVPALKTKATQHDTLLAENTTLKAEVVTLKKTAPQATQEVVDLATKLTVAETSQAAQLLRINELELANKTTQAGIKVDAFIRRGQLTPAQREGMIQLATQNASLFDTLYTAASPVVVNLSEQGVTEPGTGITTKMKPEEIKSAVDRYANMIPGAKRKTA